MKSNVVMARNESLLEDLSCVKCALCLDIFEDPRRLPCGHVYCKSCLDSLLSDPDRKCPNCRQPFAARRIQVDQQIQQILTNYSTVCEGCASQIPLLQLRNHAGNCVKMANIERLRVQQRAVPEPIVAAPNRQTFVCPFCAAKNFDCQALVKHCNQSHAGDHRPVVCPICASMPWGDQNMTSANFLQHLNLRHKFEYETYVDYQQDDDDMLRAAIQASLMTQ